MNTSVIAKTVVINADGCVLLLRRSQTDTRRPGDWDYPGGTAELHEDFADTAARETFEEAGIKLAKEDLTLQYVTNEVYPDVNLVRLLFVAHTDTTEVQLSYEHDYFEWMKPEAAAAVFKHPAWGEGLKFLLKHNLLSQKESHD